VDVEFNAGKTEHPLKLLAKNMQSIGHPFKSQGFCRAQEHIGHLILTPNG